MHAENFLESTRKIFRYYQNLGRRAIEQLSDQELHFQPDPESNNVATIVKHMVGNMLSRWTDFLHSDGEKTWRRRDQEFEDTLTSKKEILQAWEKGWICVFQAIDPLTASDLNRIAYIRNEGHTVMEAINRQLCHYAYHIGQIVLIGKMIKGKKWKSLSIPKGESDAFNARYFTRPKEDQHFTDRLMN